MKRSTRYFPGKFALVKKMEDNPVIHEEARRKYAQGPFMVRCPTLHALTVYLPVYDISFSTPCLP